jgi:hypothetical protein
MWVEKDFDASLHALGSAVRIATGYDVEVTLRPTVSRQVSLGVRPPSATRDQFFFLLEIFFRQSWVWYFVAPSLTRGRVCNLLLLLVLARLNNRGVGVRIPVGPIISTSSYRPDRLWGLPNLLSNGYQRFYSRGWNGWSVKLTTHL